MSELEAINLKLDAVLRALAALDQPKEPPLTRSAFARRVGLSPATVRRKIERQEIAVQQNRIPAAELKKFLS